jgi:copper chaperone
MRTLTFKTNINCSGCVSKVTPVLNQIHGINKWSVDTANPQKILTVETEHLHEDDIIRALKNIGYNAEKD